MLNEKVLEMYKRIAIREAFWNATHSQAEIRRRNKRRWYNRTVYCERQMFGKPDLHICKDCHFTAKRYLWKCPNCGSTNVQGCGYWARPPRRNASKMRWDQFWAAVERGHTSCR